MNVVILGSGVEGRSAQQYWEGLGASVTVRDQKDGEGYLEGLDAFDLIVRSPGVKPGDIKTTRPVTSAIREFMAKCPAPIIGVTGTKGKGTTSSLIAEILKQAGKKVWLGGNIGVVPLDFLSEVSPDDWVVLELSSFQLMDATQSPQVAVMLMLAEDHLNYHADLEEYHQAKANIFRFQKEGDLAVYNAADAKVSELVKLSKGEHLPYGRQEGAWVDGEWIMFANQRIVKVSEVGLIGAHNLENVCAAVAATWSLVGSTQPVSEAIRSFKGLPHRLELVGEHDGVRYYDDSFGVNPAASIVALRSFNEPKVAILGGFDRGLDITDLAKTVITAHVKHAVLIGQTAAELEKALAGAGFDQISTGQTTMEEVVAEAAKHASEGDVVLLSPGFPSFDMFKDYIDRGDKFQAAVKELA